jgi:cobalt-zinc-cadmium resistance protein CzcA
VLFTSTITVTAFVPLFTMQGVEGQIFGPIARTYGYALAGALLATFTVTPVLASLMIPRKVKKGDTIVVRTLRTFYTPLLEWSLGRLAISIGIGIAFLAACGN